MAANTWGFIPLLRVLTFGRLGRRVGRRAATTKDQTMCSLQRVADLAHKAASRLQPAENGNDLKWRWRRLSSMDEESRLPGKITLSDTELSELKAAVGSVAESELCVSRDDYIDFAEDNPGAIEDGVIAVVTVCERPEFTMAVFILSPGATIPLHDHAHMYVVSRVLWGALEIASYDVVDRDVNQIVTPQLGLGENSTREPVHVVQARRKPCDFVGAGEVRALTPHVGNVHSFHAREWTAVFDVLVPPYNENAGRSCTYFQLRGDKSASSSSPPDTVTTDNVTLQVRLPFHPFSLKYACVIVISFVDHFVFTNNPLSITRFLFFFLKKIVPPPDDYYTITMPYRGVKVDL